MLPLNLILLIDVTFSTPTPGYITDHAHQWQLLLLAETQL